MSTNDDGSGGLGRHDGPPLKTLDERAHMTEEVHDTAAEIASIESVPLPDDIDVANRIVVEHLHIYYGDFLAVEDVNMIIEPRAVTALIGPSGCGKSTFLRTLNRMHEVIPGAYAEGTVLLDGENLYGSRVDPVAVRRKVGMVFQRPNPFPTMSIYDNVRAGKRLNSKRLKKSEAVHDPRSRADPSAGRRFSARDSRVLHPGRLQGCRLLKLGDSGRLSRRS